MPRRSATSRRLSPSPAGACCGGWPSTTSGRGRRRWRSSWAATASTYAPRTCPNGCGGPAAGLPLDPAAWTGRELYRPCFRAAVSGTTGAGDSTVSGFLAAVCRGADPEAAVTAALATGACSTEAVDATSAVPPWPRIEQRLAAGWPRHPPTVVLE